MVDRNLRSSDQRNVQVSGSVCLFFRKKGGVTADWKNRLAPFVIKKVILTQRPLPFRKEPDKHSYCFSVLRFMAVPFPS